MKLTERSFSTKLIRPRPSSHLSSNKELIAILTEWGGHSINSKNIFDELESQYNFLSTDKESTQPFPKLISISLIENNMRSSLVQANQTLFQKINYEEYRTGFELFYATTQGHMCTVIQIGQPMMIIDRPNHILHYVGGSADRWSFSYSQKTAPDSPLNTPADPASTHTNIPPPLPGQLLGVYNDIAFHPFCFRFSSEDRLILLSRHNIPSSWFTIKRKDRDLNTLSELAVKENPDIPFWIGIIEFTSES